MNLSQFLHFNEHCPVCGDSLSLFAQVNNGPLWRAKCPTPGILHFDQFQIKTDSLGSDDFFWLEESPDGVSMDFSSSTVYQAAKTWSLFFFFLCNQDSIEDVTATSYGINPYVACYYRSTPFLELKKNEDGSDRWALKEIMGSAPIEGNIRDEIFVMKSVQPNDDEKVYVLNLDHETKNTILRYYQITSTDRKNKYFDPNIFKKDLPPLSVRPNFDLENRSQLLSRLDNWILLS